MGFFNWGKKEKKKVVRKKKVKKNLVKKTSNGKFSKKIGKEIGLDKKFQKEFPSLKKKSKDKVEKIDNLKEIMQEEMKLNYKYQIPIVETKEETKKIKNLLVKLGKKIQWTSKISVEEPNIDEQHKKIINQINVLEESLKSQDPLTSVRSCVHFLDNYVKEHFTYEEDYMEKIGYPKKKFEAHKREHRRFIEFYEQRKEALNRTLLSKDHDKRSLVLEHGEEVRKFLADWILKHTVGMDQGYHKFAKKKGLIGKNWSKKKEVVEKEKSEKKGKFNLSNIAQEVKREMISSQRKSVEEIPDLGKKKKLSFKDKEKYVLTGVPGFDELLEKGIPQGNSLIVAGGAGSGKTIMCLQTLINKAKEGKKCLYMTLEEREDRLLSHMEQFGWPAKEMVKKKKLKIVRMNPFEITRNVDALLAQQKGELLIEVDPVILPKGFKPDFIVIDSLTAIASAFTGKDESYRIYIEQLFRFLEKTDATSFLITETEQVPKIFSQTGVEEFLADGVIVLYNLKHGNVRENALEILKLRGAAHQKKIVAMQITSEGVVIYPEQEVFSDME